ncbi:hypothetical protein Q5P01_017841 [Channa striata]|uniref:DELTA-sagatoxin-Srs1a n=1 Tax=Channa striata TaxID=64152 RepID=A0AA88MDT0_CHASR|nr:hypothetical protein Q5P01_017841 [Channa striata]
MPLPVVGAVSITVFPVPEDQTTIISLPPTHRQCTIEIENNSYDYTLMTPRIYTYSGSCEKPLPAVIGVSSSGGALFVKTPHTACGSVGVFTYDLYHHPSKQNRGKMAVMFSNPYDFNLYWNWFAVGVFDISKQCDYDLYKEMYYDEEKGFVRGQAKCGFLTYTSHAVTIRATMADRYQPVIKRRSPIERTSWVESLCLPFLNHCWEHRKHPALCPQKYLQVTPQTSHGILVAVYLDAVAFTYPSLSDNLLWLVT